MKAYSRVLFIVAAIWLSAMAVFVGMTQSYRSTNTDPVFVNDMVQTVRMHWDDLDTFDGSAFSEEMLIFDSGDFPVYSTAKTELAGIRSAEEAMRRRCLCIPVAQDSRFLGTLVIPDPDRQHYNIVRQRLTMAAVVMSLLFLLTCLIYGVYVRQTIVVPFRRMEQFAENVANGDLDQPLLLERSNLFGSFTASFDIMREALRESRRREEALKIKEKELVASLSHDLRTPLTGIKLLCELLTVKVQDDYIAAKVSGIHQKAEQMDILISDLLTSSLGDLGEMSIDCCDEAAPLLHELLKAHDAKGLVREGEIPDCLLCVDRARLSQSIGNLISNSYKYAGTPIDVSFRIRDGYLEMAMQDYGGGVPEEELPLLTNKFYRGKSNAAGKDGSGLGLYIASELMERMNGELLCANRNGGFCVTLMIPLS